MTLRQFVRCHGDAALAAQVDMLERMLYRDALDHRVTWSADEFIRGLVAARRRWQQSQRASLGVRIVSLPR